MKTSYFFLFLVLGFFFIFVYPQEENELLYRFANFSLILAGFALTAGVFYNSKKKKNETNLLIESSFSFLSAGIAFMLLPSVIMFFQGWVIAHNGRYEGAKVIWIFLIFCFTLYWFVKGLENLETAVEILLKKPKIPWYKRLFKSFWK